MAHLFSHVGAEPRPRTSLFELVSLARHYAAKLLLILQSRRGGGGGGGGGGGNINAGNFDCIVGVIVAFVCLLRDLCSLHDLP